MRRGLFGSLLFVCAPIVIISSFLFFGAPLALGFQDGVAERLQFPIVMMIYWIFFFSGPMAVLLALPLSAILARQTSTRRLGFQILLGTTLLLQPAHFVFLSWLTS